MMIPATIIAPAITSQNPKPRMLFLFTVLTSSPSLTNTLILGLAALAAKNRDLVLLLALFALFVLLFLLLLFDFGLGEILFGNLKLLFDQTILVLRRLKIIASREVVHVIRPRRFLGVPPKNVRHFDLLVARIHDVDHDLISHRRNLPVNSGSKTLRKSPRRPRSRGT